MNSIYTDLNMNAGAIVTDVLPSSLATPAGWRSEILQSDLPFSTTTTSSDAIQTNTEYHSTNYVDEYSTQIPRTFSTSSNQYVNTSTENISLDEQEIIRRVETQQEPPLVVRKQLPNNLVTYQQNISLRYLQPPPPPPPGPIIIREVRPPAPPPQPPIQIRQRPPPPTTPPPLVLRERPPPIPPSAPEQVVEKLLPAPPPAPRRVVIERYGSNPPKPADVVIERWLPYKDPPQRRVLLERAPPVHIASSEPNLLILHDSPQARIRKEYINQGVVHEDPDLYLRRYGAELDTWHTSGRNALLIDEASRAIPPPVSSGRYYHDDYYGSYASRARVLSPLPRSLSYHYDYPYDDSQYDCYRRPSYRSYYDYPRYYGSYVTMADVTPSWGHYCGSSRSSYYPYRSSYPSSTIRVRSEDEFRHVLSDLTDGRFSSIYRSY